ncbi:Uncharacterised protein [Streptococcus pneumoniae]|nr:Uncharacterised protein [Streptococcus pneumoniae]CEW51053.1 Uncharacterised protein [Streptococcus pneumoniae]CEW74493.1 Uncharacterised protein [Streptococcus pneumoniae]CEX00191.1 Uncharacterised protein [Streptococcus pneumoniae]CEY50404.1 Uncharacterised protein [Streptococcus pneumoniae]
MSLDIDKEKMTIMGIAFENRSVFKSRLVRNLVHFIIDDGTN